MKIIEYGIFCLEDPPVYSGIFEPVEVFEEE